jgi:hypothetical protein
MSVSRPGELTVGSQIKLAGGLFTVASLSGTQLELVDASGVTAVMGLPTLLADPSFTLTTPRPAALTRRGGLESSPPEVLELARWWEQHVLELLAGRGPNGDTTCTGSYGDDVTRHAPDGFTTEPGSSEITTQHD